MTVSLKAVEAVAYDRASDWTGRTVARLDGSLELSAIGVHLPLRDVYRFTPLGEPGEGG